MTTIEVRTGKIPIVALGVLALIFVPMGTGLLYSGISRGFRAVPMVIGSVCLLLFGFVFGMVARSFIKSAKRFTENSLIRGDGRQLAWSDLSKVVNQIHFNRTLRRDVLWRTEIHFRDGQVAWLIPTKVSNWNEVAEFVARLNCPKEEKRV